ncbi:hypothetical protein [Pseudonocardia sp. N23]|uniref:hypothetical protein n=1 Tax=Pseudonocardia sp. N23 TaxID=1987376 RepID=UPI000BFE8445|nr:hypothetical protein [Pseudonocardia sp. N23]GAY10696.1 hypothetical protein TOK_5057 [Pseudonocardia sp. N23]
MTGAEHATGEQCARCDAVRDVDDPATALTWSREREPGDAGPGRSLCPSCVRAHTRDIEARLAPSWWAPPQR